MNKKGQFDDCGWLWGLDKKALKQRIRK